MKQALRPLLFALALALGAAGAAASGSRQSLPIAPAEIDRTVTRAMAVFAVPGMAIAIVKDGKVVYAKGYGVREIGKPAPVDTDTVFQIGSNTKAFTAAGLAILVDAGKIGWDDKVVDLLPQFQLHDAWVTREFTVRDLLTHRSGLGPGAGDLMFYPATDFTRAEIIHSLRYLKPAASFRSRFDYDNLLYMVAGEVIAAVAGQSWEDFTERQIFQPLLMRSCAANYERLEDRSNLAAAHAMVSGKLVSLPAEKITVIGAAGTINCSVNDMTKWLLTQLSAGRAPGGAPLFSAARSTEMWSMKTIKAVDPDLAALTRTHFSGYGLGWDLQDTFGRKRVSHTGGVPGMVTWVSMIPELRLGVLVFTNQQNGVAMEVVGNQILDAYLGAPGRDWVDMGVAFEARRAAAAKDIERSVAEAAAAASSPPLPLGAYAGRYVDPWRGEAMVREEGGALVLQFSRTEALKGALAPYRGNVFIVRWNDRSLDADAYVRFEQGFSGDVEGMTLQAISPATDFSFDFQDLDFRKIESPH